MGEEEIAWGNSTEPHPNAPTNHSYYKPQALASHVRIEPPFFAIKWKFSEISCYYHSNWQQCSPPNYVQNPMYLNPPPQKQSY